jgi:cob(I)alamin adenosyltransferase
MYACGDVDALVSMLGITKALVIEGSGGGCGCRMIEEIEWIQRKLFVVGSEIATTNTSVLTKRITSIDLDILDANRTFLEGMIKLPKDFILPGNNSLSANLDMCRVLCRALERSVIKLTDNGMVNNDYLIPFMNRLSDYIYLLARQTESNNYNIR